MDQLEVLPVTMFALIWLVGVLDGIHLTRFPFNLTVLNALLGISDAYKDCVSQEDVDGLRVYLEDEVMLLDGYDGDIPVNMELFIPSHSRPIATF